MLITQWCLTLYDSRLLCPWDSPDQNTGVGCHVPFQGVFQTQGSNPNLMSAILAGGFFTISTTWEALNSVWSSPLCRQNWDSLKFRVTWHKLSALEMLPVSLSVLPTTIWSESLLETGVYWYFNQVKVRCYLDRVIRLPIKRICSSDFKYLPSPCDLAEIEHEELKYRIGGSRREEVEDSSVHSRGTNPKGISGRQVCIWW